MRCDTNDFAGDLISRAQAGELNAFECLAEQHAEALCRCALMLCRDRQRAEDLAQETLLEAWRSLARFDGRCRFSTWLYGILRHRYLKSVRRRQVSTATPWDQSHAETLPHLGLDPESILQQSEDAKRIRQAVEQLPDEHRSVIELRFFADATLDEIAAALDVPVGTVKSRLHNGLEKLRKQNLVMNLFETDRESPARQS